MHTCLILMAGIAIGVVVGALAMLTAEILALHHYSSAFSETRMPLFAWIKGIYRFCKE